MTALAKKVFELFGKPELAAETQSKPAEEQIVTAPSPWPCPHCGRPAEIEAVEPRQDDGVRLTFWNCSSCQTCAVTPATLREPPVWVSRKEQ
jgi:hypothetical protein